jgi:hypothetical protein
MTVKRAALEDVVEVFGDTAVPLAVAPGFRGALLLADPSSGRLISLTVCGTRRPG